MKSRQWVLMDNDLPRPQYTHYGNVEGVEANAMAGEYTLLVRLPVMGPHVQLFIDNDAGPARRVSLWGYLVA